MKKIQYVAQTIITNKNSLNLLYYIDHTINMKWYEKIIIKYILGVEKFRMLNSNIME